MWPRSILWVSVINIVAVACLWEITLRAQQKLGPFYDLDLRPEAILIGISDELNHLHPPSEEWDRDGIRRTDDPNAPQCGPTLLFMGDSFMEGPSTDETVPYHVKRFFSRSIGKEICVFNAACSSYSPSIFVPQAKKLIPLLRPDIVVIDIDETDIYDDYHRYRALVTRDAGGSITAVRHTPIALQFQEGLVESMSKPLYLQRLVSKLYFTKIVYPSLFAKYYENKPIDFLWLSRLPATEAREKYGPAIDHFKITLADLMQTVLSQIGRTDALVLVHHPHLEHLKAGDGAFNNVVSGTIREVALRYNVKYYDAAADLRAEFGDKPEAYYIPNDMHFNAAGQKAYGLLVAKYLARALAP